VPEFASIPPDLLAVAGIPQEPLFRSSAQPTFSVYNLSAFQPVPRAPFDEPISFEGVIKLEGYELLPPDSESLWQLVTFWRVEDKLPADLRIFIHMIDAAGNLVAQHDGFDAAPGELQSGDLVIQYHIIGLEEPVGLFELQVGLYTLHNQQRLQPVGVQRDIVVLTRVGSVDGK
jgi:hypothetical protein